VQAPINGSLASNLQSRHVKPHSFALQDADFWSEIKWAIMHTYIYQKLMFTSGKHDTKHAIDFPELMLLVEKMGK
jgi:hypothetical protein